MTVARTKKAVIIGVGMVAQTHLDAIAASNAVILHGIMGRDSQRALAFHNKAEAQLGYRLRHYNRIDEIAGDEAVDFGIILTPPNVREEIITPLAKAGKHILLEKPVGRNSDEARQIVDICQKHGVSLGIVFQMRMREASKIAAEIIRDGALGRLALCEVSVPWWRPQTYYDEPGRGTYSRDGGGVLLTQAIHIIDLTLSLTGRAETVQAMAVTSRMHEMEAEDFVTAGIKFANGAAGSFMASTASFPGSSEVIALHFEKATLRLHSGQLDIHWHDGRTETIGSQGQSGTGANPMAFSHDLHQAIIEDFAESLVKLRKPAISGTDALPAHALIDAMLLSAKTGCKEPVIVR
ncbi:Gfo/Idh/MocA family protein [Falsochrobactrum ovis]|uniref:Putative dehydrogenase n=1 Tax=Falsochrobactrum ovis TaxID=1293442 RepID=A0A364JSE8_9HYPH|nr:Gfo/Idh/MocA family oxidoreductase [Falsochrobactrum ovis]RAK26087.1 putative dehydrogenase [Falsochrobactrum ovis]